MVLILLILVAGIAAFVTFSILSPRVEEAQKEATAAKSQVSTLTQQLANQSKNSSSTSDTDKKDGTSSSSSSSSSTSSSSAAAKDGVEDPWTKSGTYTSGDTVLDGEVKAFVDSKVNKDSMSLADATLEIYKGIAWSDYVERDSAQKPKGKNWRSEYARMYYENSCSGNCYEFAAFLMYCLQYLGYDDATAEGLLIELESGSWGDHAVVFVTNTDGSKCMCDTARGTNGYMISANSYNMKVQDFESE